MYKYEDDSYLEEERRRKRTLVLGAEDLNMGVKVYEGRLVLRFV